MTVHAVEGVDIALAPIGQPGPIAFTLPITDGSIAGQLTAADLAPSAGVTFDAAMDAIASGGAYVNVRTQADPTGELRGQIQPLADPPSFTMTGTERLIASRTA